MLLGRTIRQMLTDSLRFLNSFRMSFTDLPDVIS